MINLFKRMIKKRQDGILTGITSYCTANKLAIEAILKQGKRFNDFVLIEATANQVNQYGGYTGMKPVDFKCFVYEIADSIDFPKANIILGGDHLGPLRWADESEKVAMEKSKELVKSYIFAGFKKIHLDTSMRLFDDNKNECLSNQVIARRGVLLYKACEEAYQELLKENPDEIRPFYIIGSEVPIPGGAQEEESINITNPVAVYDTISAYERQFKKCGYENAFENIIGIVVQPGVEFSNTDIYHYNRNDAKKLSKYLEVYNKIVFEGHSTDFQSAKNLKKMVEDGFAILKVGPALTFALREALFSLSMIEEELIQFKTRSNFIKVLEKVMKNNPENWKNHYSGLENELRLQRKYSFSDRCRYYFSNHQVIDAINKLFENLKSVDIPLCMLK